MQSVWAPLLHCNFTNWAREILCRRLNKQRGIVSSRVALLLRSAEIKPLFYWFVLFHERTSHPPFSFQCTHWRRFDGFRLGWFFSFFYHYPEYFGFGELQVFWVLVLRADPEEWLANPTLPGWWYKWILGSGLKRRTRNPMRLLS